VLGNHGFDSFDRLNAASAQTLAGLGLCCLALGASVRQHLDFDASGPAGVGGAIRIAESEEALWFHS
jgi:hypothetical protein